MKDKITAFIDGLIVYDYILFGSVFALFLLFIILAIIARKKVVLALFLTLFSFVLLFFGSIVGYVQMHKFLFKNSTKLVSQKNTVKIQVKKNLYFLFLQF